VRIHSRWIVLTRSFSNGIRQREVSLSVVVSDLTGVNTSSGGGAPLGYVRAVPISLEVFVSFVHRWMSPTTLSLPVDHPSTTGATVEWRMLCVVFTWQSYSARSERDFVQFCVSARLWIGYFCLFSSVYQCLIDCRRLIVVRSVSQPLVGPFTDAF